MRATCLWFVAMLGVLPAQVLAADLSTEQKKQSLAYVQALLRENGAYAASAKPDAEANLGATSSALRAIKYYGGKVTHEEQTGKFVRSCFDKATGGFAPLPGGKPDVRTTSVGLMACHELKIDDKALLEPACEYLCKQATSFEDIRIAAAAFDTLKKPSRLAADWLKVVQQQANRSGSFGTGVTQARDTGGCAVTVLRLGGKLEHPGAIVKALNEGQLKAGGWGKEADKADLETTYRVMRCYMMMKEKPNITACRAFLASCRQADGSYSLAPGQPGNTSATYFASIVLHWLADMEK